MAKNVTLPWLWPHDENFIRWMRTVIPGVFAQLRDQQAIIMHLKKGHHE